MIWKVNTIAMVAALVHTGVATVGPVVPIQSSANSSLTTATTTSASSTSTKIIVPTTTSTGICGSPTPGFAWQSYKLKEGSGIGRIPYNFQYGKRSFNSSRFDLNLALDGVQKPSANGRTNAVGWEAGTYFGECQRSIDSTTANIPDPFCSGSLGREPWPVVTGGDTEYFLHQHTAYFLLNTNGTYTFELKYADDVAYMWVGNQAVSNYTAENANLFADLWLYYRDGEQRTPTPYPVTLQYKATAGVPVPVRVLLANALGAFALSMTVNSPTGAIVMQSPPQNFGKNPAADGHFVYCAQNPWPARSPACINSGLATI